MNRPPQPPLTRAALAADRPTWCPGCGDFSVLAAVNKILEKRQYPHESIVTVAGIGCSSRIPYFLNTHGVHFIHGRALPLASALSLARPDLHILVFGGDGDGFSIGGNHLEHAARKNLHLTYIIMDNSVYGMTKNQTSPTSPRGFKSKTDPFGALDAPVNPVKKMLAAGATFVARTHSAQMGHLTEMIERGMDHQGFSAIQVLSDCANFFAGAFDGANPRKGGRFTLLEERHDVTDEAAAYALAGEEFPGRFGVYYQAQRPSKNALENELIAKLRGGEDQNDHEILRKTFAEMK